MPSSVSIRYGSQRFGAVFPSKSGAEVQGGCLFGMTRCKKQVNRTDDYNDFDHERI